MYIKTFITEVVGFMSNEVFNKKDFLEAKIKIRLIERFTKTLDDFVIYKTEKLQSHNIAITDTFFQLYTDEIKNAFHKFINLYSAQYFNVNEFINIRKYYQSLVSVNSIYYNKHSRTNYTIHNKDIKTFEQLKEVIKTRLNINDDIVNEIFLLLLNQSVLDYYSTKWINEYPILMDGSLEKFVSDCVYSDLIVKNDKSMLSSMYFYIASKKEDIDIQLLPNQKMIDEVNVLIKKYSIERENKQFENFLFSENKNQHNLITIDDVDLMDGFEFERFVQTLFVKMGFNAYNTQKAKDQGIDVIAEKNGIKYGVQCKCYSSSVGNNAIQEVVAGKQYYKLDKVIVITNNDFTKSAISLAEANNVILWNRFILDDKIKKFLNQ